MAVVEGVRGDGRVGRGAGTGAMLVAADSAVVEGAREGRVATRAPATVTAVMEAAEEVATERAAAAREGAEMVVVPVAVAARVAARAAVALVAAAWVAAAWVRERGCHCTGSRRSKSRKGCRWCPWGPGTHRTCIAWESVSAEGSPYHKR
jgi:hypothetical protein